MGFLGKLFGGGEAKKPLTAREAVPLAQEALREWSATQAAAAQMCCVYTSGEDANRELRKDGRCRAWHVDYYMERSRSFYLARVVDGKVKGRERPLSESPVEYVYCVYGAEGGEKNFAEPVPLPAEWIDSDLAARAAFAALEREMAGTDRGILDDYIPLSICLPAQYVRYIQPDASGLQLTQAPPQQLCFAVLLSHIDADDHDSLIVYVDAATGREAAAEKFRFQAFQTAGFSADW